MRLFYRALLLGVGVAILKYLLWALGYTYWELGLISISGLVAGIFFILSAIFRSALVDFKEASKSICNIRGKVCSMNDINMNAALVSEKEYDPGNLSQYLIETLKTIKAYLEDKNSFNELQDTINGIVQKSAILDEVIPANKVSRFQQYHDHLRGHISYLEHGKSLHFPKVGYTFLYFFIFLLLFLQVFSHTENILLEVVFIFSLSSVLIFFADLIRDLDRPFLREKAAFAVDLEPLDAGIKTIERSLQGK